MPSAQELRELAAHEPGAPVLSALIRTDPRDPQNTHGEPAWPIELRNGLRAAEEGLEGDELKALRAAAADMESWAKALSPADRGRSVVRFLAADGSFDRVSTLQLPITRTTVVWDASPYILPLVAVADRGAPTGLVLVGNDSIRLLSWEGGRVAEVEGGSYEVEFGEWKDYSGFTAGNPGRGVQTGHNVEAIRARTENAREGFRREAAAAIDRRVGELGWRRIALAGEGSLAADLEAELAQGTRGRVVGTVSLNLADHSPAEIAERAEPVLLGLWADRARGFVAEAIERSRAGGAGATGVTEVSAALTEGRVDRLLIDPYRDYAETVAGNPAAGALLRGSPARFFAEKAVEAAISGGGAVTSLPNEVGEGTELGAVGGIAALLRY
jgi:hypothetical protein